MIWYRSAAVAGVVFINTMGKTEITNIETFLFTFGKGAKDAARAGALVQAAEVIAKGAVEAIGGKWIRVWTVGEEVFSPVEPAVSKGLGAYRVGVRVADETVAKVDVRYRQSVGAVFNAVVGAVERGVAAIRGVLG